MERKKELIDRLMVIDDKEFLIRSAAEKDYEVIERLCTLRFGTGYLHREEFLQWLKHPELFLVMECEGDFVGYVVFVPSSPRAMADYIRFPVEEIEKDAGGKEVIHCRSTALFPAYGHRGLMRVLWVEIMETVRRAGYPVAYGPAWKYNDYIPMDHLLTSFGFAPVGERENLWYDDKDYTCIICGGPCVCPAVIYKLKF